jgi:hypothetical protein
MGTRNNNFFLFFIFFYYVLYCSTKLADRINNNGDCSLMVEHWSVDPKVASSNLVIRLS